MNIEAISECQARLMAQVCLDLHAALGVEWGGNPYLVISTLNSLVVRDVVGERQRQIAHEGWSHSHDDKHKDGSLALAGACYASAAAAYFKTGGAVSLDVYSKTVSSFRWPWLQKWWKPKTPRRDLVRSAALIIAEIERIDRMGSTQQENQ